jgi:hypothetical protein
MNFLNLHGATLDLDDEEHHVPNRAEWAQGFHAEEVTGIQRVPVHLQELLPGSLLLPLWRRLDSLFCQDVRHRRPSDLDLQARAKRVADNFPDSKGGAETETSRACRAQMVTCQV